VLLALRIGLLLKILRTEIGIEYNLLGWRLLLKLLILVMSWARLRVLNLLNINLRIRFGDFLDEVVFVLNDWLRAKIVCYLIWQVINAWFYVLNELCVGFWVIDLIRVDMCLLVVILVLFK